MENLEIMFFMGVFVWCWIDVFISLTGGGITRENEVASGGGCLQWFQVVTAGGGCRKLK